MQVRGECAAKELHPAPNFVNGSATIRHVGKSSEAITPYADLCAVLLEVHVTAATGR